MLGLAHHAAEIGQEAAEHAGFVHPRQRNLGLVRRGHDIDEQPVRLGVVAHPVVDPAQILGHQPQRVGMDIEAFVLADMEQPNHRHRVAGEHLVVAHRQAVAVELEALEVARPAKAR